MASKVRHVEVPDTRPQTPPLKRQRQDSDSHDQWATRLKVFFSEGIPHRALTVPIWTRKLLEAGGQVAQAAGEPGTTHRVLGPYDAAPEGGAAASRAVTTGWLLQCFSEHRLVDPGPFEAAAPGGQDSGSEGEAAHEGPMRRYKTWLGHWEPAYDEITTQTELVLQAVFSEENGQRWGNTAIVTALTELAKYERALEGDFVREDPEERGGGQGRRSQSTVNSRSLKWARAAAVVRGAAFSLAEAVARGERLPEMPFVGVALRRQLQDLAATGTTRQLEEHRANAQVHDSSGNARPGAVGGAARRAFQRLPGVGAATAEQWYLRGLRTLEEVEAAVEDGRLHLRREQLFSLRHRASLTAPCTESDVAEMEAAVRDALAAVSGGASWVLERVGGARRSSASHDADFVAYPLDADRGVDGCGRRLADELIARKQLAPPSEAMCIVQDGKLEERLEDMRRQDGHAKGNLSADRFDRVFGVFRTSAGAVRRLDVILSPPEEAAFCLLGWSGSRQWLRFLRQHAVERGMRLNSHRLMRGGGGSGLASLVPDEGPPLSRAGRPQWPPGWGPQRRVASERDILELLGVPYREPHERNA